MPSEEAEDPLYAVYHQMDGGIPSVTPGDLVVSVALKIEHWLQKIPSLALTTKNVDTLVFAVLAREGIQDCTGNQKMAKVIARLGVVQALLTPEINKNSDGL